MGAKYKVVHYLNQFFGQIGGEEKADIAPFMEEGKKGPGILLTTLLGSDFEIVATIICGDNYIAQDTEKAIGEILEMVSGLKPDVFVAGPAFNAGRYGPACGAVCKAVGEKYGVPCITGMFEENPGVEMYRKDCYIVSTKNSAVGMKFAMDAIVGLTKKLAAGEPLNSPEQENYFARGFKKNIFVEKTGAQRAVEMLLKKVNGEPFQTELNPPAFESVPPAKAVVDMKNALIALVTEGGIVDIDNKEGLESARATKFVSFDITGLQSLKSGAFKTIHGGFDNTFGNDNPNRIVPLDALRVLENEKKIGKLHHILYSTTGNSTTIKNAEVFGREIAKNLKESEVQAAILTST